MQNGVFFRLTLTLAKKSVAGWKKAKIHDQRQRIPGEHTPHEGGSILGGELSVLGKTLKAALGELEAVGMELQKKDIEHWERVTLDGKPHIRIETKGAVKRDATVRQLIEHLKKEESSGAELVHVERDGKDGNVDIFGYLGGYDAYSDHFLPLLMLGSAAGDAGGTGTLVFLADVELRHEAVLVHASFSNAGVELVVHSEPQDVTEEEAAVLQAGLGDGGEARIRELHARWLDRFVDKKRKRAFAGRVGWLRPDGTFAIEPRYRSAGQFAEGLAHVAENGPFDYGYIDARGELVIPYGLFSTNGFKEGRALSQLHVGLKGYIDRRGVMLIEPRWSHAEDFSEGRAVVGEWARRGYIDLDGKQIIPERYQTTRPFTEGLALVAEHDQYSKGGYGFFDRDGKVAIPLTLECAGVFHEGFALASRDGLWGFLDPSGKFLFPPRFPQCGYLVEGRALALLDQKWGVVDAEGNVVLPHAHARLRDHFDWYLAEDAESTTFFSKQGAQLFRVPYTVIGELRDDRMTISNSHGGPFGYMDRAGNVLIEPRYRSAAPFADGLAIVEDEDGKWGIIDHSGKMTKVFDFRLRPASGASHFAKNGLAWIQDLSAYGLVNREGKLIHPPELEQLYGFGEDSIWVQYPEDDA